MVRGGTIVDSTVLDDRYHKIRLVGPIWSAKHRRGINLPALAWRNGEVIQCHTRSVDLLWPARLGRKKTLVSYETWPPGPRSIIGSLQNRCLGRHRVRPCR